MSKITSQLASLLLVAGWFAFSGTPAAAQEQEALLEGSNAPDASAAGQAVERTDGIECLRQMPQWRPDPHSMFKC